MITINNPDDLFFPVDEHPVCFDASDEFGHRHIRIPEKKALVNRWTSRAVGVVSRNYRLVTNRRALSMAHDCCRAIFPDTGPSEWQVHHMEAPRTLSSCCIDLRHCTTALDFSLLAPDQRPEAFGPFVRVMNSYNGQCALTFYIGFMRKVCSNGLILPDAVITLRFNHLRPDIEEALTFPGNENRLAELRASLSGWVAVLGKHELPARQFRRLVMAALGLSRPKHADRDGRVEAAWKALEASVAALCDRYAGELGLNAYAALNAMTDFASHPPDNPCVYRHRHSLQQRAGAWTRDFSTACRRQDFDLDRHITDLERSRAA